MTPDEELEMALALSQSEAEERERQRQRQEAQDHALAVEEDRREKEAMDRALAVELEGQQGWTCSRCLLDNAFDEGRCRACLADREAPFVASGGQPSRSTCGLPGCNALATRGFCSEEHRRRARKRSLVAPATDDVERCFVGPSGEFSVSLLTHASPKRRDLVEHFRSAWKKGRPPTVKHVYRVVPRPSLRDRFDRYSAAVGNVRLRYHGTSCACDFGIDLNAPPCDGAACALCSILDGGFKLDKAGSGPNRSLRALRYGSGIYLSATSGKSNDYAVNTERLRKWKHDLQERWRVILVCSVAAGRAFKTSEAQLHLPDNKPPPSYDSVVGEVGDNLNYDELVVYSEHAVLPEYMIIYAVKA